MTPTPKSKAIDDLLTAQTGISRQIAAQLGVCTWCKQSITSFRDLLSVQEYNISGFCQSCQDKTFGADQ